MAAIPTVTLRHAFIPLDNRRLAYLCGTLDEHLRGIEAAFDVSIKRRNESFRVEGARRAAEGAVAFLQSLYERAAEPVDPEHLQLALVEATSAQLAPRPRSTKAAADAAHDEAIVLRTRHADLAGRTPNQTVYLRSILAHDVTFGIGPAGTGKTFLAVACAVDAIERSAVQRIILTRPAVEAGERLGFLPGDLAQKVDPYLRPLYDALNDMVGPEHSQRLLERGSVEVAPLAFMRGRTLNGSFIILDEAQNTTPEQMKMFLTRLGFGSKAVITGDVTQVDVPGGRSGLDRSEAILSGIEGVSFVHLTGRDVVRHRIVQDIVDAYARHDQEAPAERGRR
jgi:phosphate starvation-inducible PhoH-like protein